MFIHSSSKSNIDIPEPINLIKQPDSLFPPPEGKKQNCSQESHQLKALVMGSTQWITTWTLCRVKSLVVVCQARSYQLHDRNRIMHGGQTPVGSSVHKNQ